MNKQKNKHSINVYICLIIYFLINLFLISKHEMWRDEAQAWTIAKNLSLVELFKILRVEGHPCLWFIVIMPFAKLGFSFYKFQYISLAIMMICAYIFITKVPLSFKLKLLVLFSSVFTYYNTSIVRVYSIALLILVLIAIAYKNRFSKPYLYMALIALLFQTHIKYFGLALGLCVEYVLNKKQQSNKPLIIPFCSVLFLFAELFQTSKYKGYDSITIETFIGTSLKDFIYKLYRGFERIAFSSFGIKNIIVFFVIYLIIIYLVLKMLIIVIKNKKTKEYLGIIICCVLSIGVYYAITAFVHGSHVQMATILSGIVIMLTNMIFEKNDIKIKKISTIIFIMFFGLSYINLVKDVNNDIKNVYSYGQETANYICNNIEKNSIVIISYDYCNPIVYSYVSSERNDISFFDFDKKEKYKFHQWQLSYNDINYDDVVNYSINVLKDKDVYFLSTSSIYNESFELVYSSLDKNSIQQEQFALYKINN